MQTSNQTALKGRHIAILMTDGVEQAEYVQPRKFLEKHGAAVTLIAPKDKGETVQGFNHLTPANQFTVELDIRDARAGDFDALVLPGGVANPDSLRINNEAIAFIREFARENKTIAAICHGPWTLIAAGLVRGKRMTSWPSLREDLSNAGGEWVDAEVVTDGALITSRKPDDIPAFNQEILNSLNPKH